MSCGLYLNDILSVLVCNLDIMHHTDSRLLSYLPSVIATAIISVVIKEVDPCNAIDYQAQLMDILKSSKVYLQHIIVSCTLFYY